MCTLSQAWTTRLQVVKQCPNQAHDWSEGQLAYISVVLWPWLEARASPKPLYHSPPQLKRERKYSKRLISWDKNRKRSPTSGHHGQNRLHFGKSVELIANQNQNVIMRSKTDPSPLTFLFPGLKFYSWYSISPLQQCREWSLQLVHHIDFISASFVGRAVLPLLQSGEGGAYPRTVLWNSPTWAIPTCTSSSWPAPLWAHSMGGSPPGTGWPLWALHGATKSCQQPCSILGFP